MTIAVVNANDYAVSGHMHCILNRLQMLEQGGDDARKFRVHIFS